jgi:hypothetical protein
MPHLQHQALQNHCISDHPTLLVSVSCMLVFNGVLLIPVVVGDFQSAVDELASLQAEQHVNQGLNTLLIHQAIDEADNSLSVLSMKS